MIDVNGLRGDFVLSADLRFDLAPIPATFEARLRITPQTAADYRDNALITVNEMPFRIIKSEPSPNAGGVQGSSPIAAVSIVALPEGCQAVARPLTRAVVFRNAGLAAIYRACGATVPLDGDFVVGRFSCFIGSVPTYRIAQVLQEESAVVTWRKGRLSATRLRELFQQQPLDALDIESADDVYSGFLEADQIPAYFSVGPDGAFVQGQRSGAPQAMQYSPRKNVRELNAMNRVMVRRKVVSGVLNPTIRAGDLFDVRGTPLAVMTAVHHMENDTDGQGMRQLSKFWLGGLS
ncbi:hypothetical protein LGM46_29630 [Burkholderia arboris]|uniref:hypothetical protein n=1 Tax=Burkholderia arboris TaxID=488730 RepID=UPI001CF26260|nr:hypothetical protein [Burkholderia arboris]MCA8037132.1 hypothetical protein [Burkholderia arboris]